MKNMGLVLARPLAFIALVGLGVLGIANIVPAGTLPPEVRNFGLLNFLLAGFLAALFGAVGGALHLVLRWLMRSATVRWSWKGGTRVHSAMAVGGRVLRKEVFPDVHDVYFAPGGIAMGETAFPHCLVKIALVGVEEGPEGLSLALSIGGAGPTHTMWIPIPHGCEADILKIREMTSCDGWRYVPQAH